MDETTHPTEKRSVPPSLRNAVENIKARLATFEALVMAVGLCREVRAEEAIMS